MEIVAGSFLNLHLSVSRSRYLPMILLTFSGGGHTQAQRHSHQQRMTSIASAENIPTTSSTLISSKPTNRVEQLYWIYDSDGVHRTPQYIRIQKNFNSVLFVNICDLSCFGICCVWKFLAHSHSLYSDLIFFQFSLAVDIRWWFLSSCFASVCQREWMRWFCFSVPMQLNRDVFFAATYFHSVYKCHILDARTKVAFCWNTDFCL